MATVSLGKDFKFDKKGNLGAIKKLTAQNEKAKKITLVKNDKLKPKG